MCISIFICGLVYNNDIRFKKDQTVKQCTRTTSGLIVDIMHIIL